MKLNKFNSLTALTLLLLTAGACSENFLEPTVSTEKDIKLGINTLEDLEALLIGAYDRMNAAPYYGQHFIVFGEVRSNNAFSSGSSGRFVAPGQFALLPTDAYVNNTWAQIYSVIANANIVINATVKDNESDQVKYVKGQAYTIRSLAYMDLLQLYGQQYSGGDLGVPLITSFNDGNIYPVRASVQEVWNQVGDDLRMAVDLMDPSRDVNDNTKITSKAAYALQTRYYLYTKQYDKVITSAELLIGLNKYTISSPATFSSSWIGSGSTNTIFQLAFTGSDNLDYNSIYFIYQQTSYGDIQVTQDLYNLYEDADIRQDLFSVNGIRIRMIGKYPSANYTDHIKVIRYEEVILNYAEALVRTDSPDALTYLNLIPSNRNASLFTEATVNNVLLERRKELAMEGFGFIELVRNGMGIPYVDSRQTFDPGGIPYGSPKLAFPIPQNEVSANPNIEQNEGY